MSFKLFTQPDFITVDEKYIRIPDSILRKYKLGDYEQLKDFEFVDLYCDCPFLGSIDTKMAVSFITTGQKSEHSYPILSDDMKDEGYIHAADFLRYYEIPEGIYPYNFDSLNDNPTLFFKILKRRRLVR
jgi:hypothetical protein